MENISEKPKRGRPRKFGKEYMQLMASLWPDLRSSRGVQEAVMMSLAHSAIQEQYETDKAESSWATYYLEANGRHILHRAILAALGRIEEKEVMLDTARSIAIHRMKTPEALQEVRGVRDRLTCTRDAELMQAVMSGRIDERKLTRPTVIGEARGEMSDDERQRLDILKKLCLSS